MIDIHTYFKWVYYELNQRHLYNLGTGLFIWLFLALAQPFGIYDNNLRGLLALILHLAPMGLLFPVISYGVDAMANGHIQSSIRKDLLILLLKVTLLIHGFYLLRELVCNWQCVDLREYAELWFAGFLMVGITYFPMALYGRSRYYHDLVGYNSPKHQEITLRGEGRETVVVNLDEVAFLKADDNYVDIHYAGKTNGNFEKKTIRSTLKAMEKQLVTFPHFQRAHRSYIVNLRFVVSNKSDRMVLATADWEAQVPLSPSYKNLVLSLLA